MQTFGSSQPVSKQAERSQPPGRLFGAWPVFLSSENTYFVGQAASLWISAEYDGPLLVRGRQLDGSGGMPLGMASWSSPPRLWPEGLELPAASAPGWRNWSGEIASGTGPGCYGLQADGFTFTSVVVFSVLPGLPPPA